jgi:hypothetical protein
MLLLRSRFGVDVHSNKSGGYLRFCSFFKKPNLYIAVVVEPYVGQSIVTYGVMIEMLASSLSFGISSLWKPIYFVHLLILLCLDA